MGKARAVAKAQVSVTFDTGSLIALERGNRRVIALLERLTKTDGRVHLPSGVAAQAWRDGARQAILSRFLASPEVEVEVLDLPLAQACGELCAARGTSDVIDASVVLVARQYGDAILTSDIDDLRRLDSSAVLERV